MTSTHVLIGLPARVTLPLRGIRSVSGGVRMRRDVPRVEGHPAATARSLLERRGRLRTGRPTSPA